MMGRNSGPDFMQDELDFAPKNVSKIVEIAPVAPQLAVAVSCKSVVCILLGDRPTVGLQILDLAI